MPKIVHFEMETKDPEAKIAFYEHVFGWKFSPFFEGYWYIETGDTSKDAVSGGLMLGTEEGLRTINTIEVSSLDEFIEKVVEKGGKLTSEKMEIPDVGTFVYCTDPEDLPIGLLEPKRS